jgi:hypothetical protein
MWHVSLGGSRRALMSAKWILVAGWRQVAVHLKDVVVCVVSCACKLDCCSNISNHSRTGRKDSVAHSSLPSLQQQQ